MGNLFSITPNTVRATEDVMESESETMNNANASHTHTKNEIVDQDVSYNSEARAKAKEEEMNEFKKQLSIKREQRKVILARHRAEKEELEKKLKEEIKSKLELCESNKLLRELLLKNNIQIPDNLINQKDSEIMNAITYMRDEFEKLKSNNHKLRMELSSANSSLQSANADMADLSAQNTESIKQINALKEVVRISKTLIGLRDQQLMELKNKLNEIEQSLADREANMLSTDLRQEYERQLQNIRTLRGLYEDRARLAEVTRQNLVRELEEQKALHQFKEDKCNDLTAQVEGLEAKVSTLEETLQSKSYQITSLQEECQGLKAEMLAVNKLFSQVLPGYKDKQDLDKLVHRLEENHGILTHMAENENDSEASSALPKLLLELVNQVDEVENPGDILSTIKCLESNEQAPNKSDGENIQSKNAEEIVQNLPKVWRVIMELLSHQTVTDTNSEKVTTCYKSVETKSGSVLVPSVSQTYIRLKDLIVEKLALIKEVNRMKQLNTHLETRLEEQERRLCLVTTELSKTWHVVGRLRRHHHQLHTHEKILKYELQQKRKLLNELKEELEYCREKWEQAREKNSQSEKDWRKLRAEFSSRKTNSPLNNSAESGYSDERPSDDSSESSDENEHVFEPMVKCNKKNKKSFETIPDSSTDFNPAAEREDPASDLLDVADLPLDTQEGDENLDSVSDHCSSESMPKKQTPCDETENENGDLNYNTDTDNSSIDQVTCDKSNLNIESSKENKDSIPGLDSTDKKDQIDCNSQGVHSSIDNNINTNKECDLPASSREITINSYSSDIPGNKLDPKAILENIKNQNERLAKKDERLKSLEEGCREVVRNFSSTLNEGDRMIEKIKSINNNRKKENNVVVVFTNSDASTNTKQSLCENNVQHECLSKKNEENFDDLQRKINGDENISTNTNECEPSTSGEAAHEARFAARDLRLKNLEEQTKSLVNRVNKTTTKCVKINYKLEELHNIYGSESSRAGTPSEDNGDRSQSTENEEDVDSN